jgi:hypothetical protein
MFLSIGREGQGFAAQPGETVADLDFEEQEWGWFLRPIIQRPLSFRIMA